jgi:hypothetical protein
MHQLARLQQRLDLGPTTVGYGEDQRWALARVVALNATMFQRPWWRAGRGNVVKDGGMSDPRTIDSTPWHAVRATPPAVRVDSGIGGRRLASRWG